MANMGETYGMIGKRVMILIAVILILGLNTFGIIFLHPINSEKPAETVAFEKTLDLEYISMYGDPKNWDDEKDMAIDKNGDGENDAIFKIAFSKYEGINLIGSVRQSDGSWKSMDFWSADLSSLFKKSLLGKAQERIIKSKDFLTLDLHSIFSLLQEGKYLVKGGCVLDDDYVQISVRDIDKDGVDEVLVSVGNQINESVTAIYEFSDTGRMPFTYQESVYSDIFLIK